MSSERLLPGSRDPRLAVAWRGKDFIARDPATPDRLEWWGAGLALLLQSGALFPLLLASPDGVIDDHARSLLRLVSLSASAISLALLARHLRQLVLALSQALHVVVLMLLPFVSVIWSIGAAATLKSGIGLTLGMALPLLIALRFSPRQFLVLTASVLGACMVLSLLLAGGAPGLAFMPSEAELRGVYLHKNVLGWAAGLCSIAAIALMRDADRKISRFGLPLLGASLACLVLSGSATGLLSVAFALIVEAFYRSVARRRGLGRFVVVLLFLQFVGLTLIFLGSYLLPMLEALGKDATLTGRVPLWRLVDQEIADHLLLGFGYQAFWTEGSNGAWNIWAEVAWQAPHSHNGYRETLLNFGLLGLGLLAVLLAISLRQGVRLHLAYPSDQWLWLNVLVGVFLVMNLTESLFLDAGAFPWTLFATAVLMFAVRHPGLRIRPAGLPRLSRPRASWEAAAPGFR